MFASEKHKPSRILVASLCAIAALAVLDTASATAAIRNHRAVLTPRAAKHSTSGVTQIGAYNWSGWAQTAPAGTFHSAVDTWVVPTVASGPGLQFASDWVGIGGLTDGTLVQDGTQVINDKGATTYEAWTEILPEPEDPLALTVHPGDKIKATVAEIKPGVWKMTVADKTTKKTASRTQAYAGSSHASVEAIHERPCIADGCESVSDFAELAPTNDVTFDPGKYGTTSKPKTGLMILAPKGLDYQIFMMNNADTAVIASPSAEDNDHDGFTVADGAVSPPPPKS